MEVNSGNTENGAKKRGPKKGCVRVGGRQKGTPNKPKPDMITVRVALSYVFDKMGGIDSFFDWGNKNRDEFYRMWSKMMPLEVTGSGGGAIQTQDVSEKVSDFNRAMAELAKRS